MYRWISNRKIQWFVNFLFLQTNNIDYEAQADQKFLEFQSGHFSVKKLKTEADIQKKIK